MFPPCSCFVLLLCLMHRRSMIPGSQEGSCHPEQTVTAIRSLETRDAKQTAFSAAYCQSLLLTALIAGSWLLCRRVK